MTDKTAKVNGISLQEWEAAFRPGMHEFCASRFIYTLEHRDQVRIAFGNSGPMTSDNGDRNHPIYTHAVTLPPDVAVEMARLLLKSYAEPEDSHSKSSRDV